MVRLCRTRRLIGGVLLAMVCGLTASGAGFGAASAAPSAEPEPPAPLNVLQLGDSYSSGVGARDDAGRLAYQGLCLRSDFGYGGQFAQALGATFRNVACGAAVMDNVEGRQILPLAEGPQIDAVDDKADVVLFTMGGNDLGFLSIFTTCFTGPSAVGCRNSIEVAKEALPGLEERAVKALTAVRAKMRPDAALIYLGYPNLTSAKDYRLPLGSGETYNVSAAMEDLIASGDRVIASVVDRLNASAVCPDRTFDLNTIDDIFAGKQVDHSGVNPPAETWLWADNEGLFFEAYHPKPAGYRAMAKELGRFYAADVARPTTLTVDPASTRAGSEVSISGSGFRSGDTVRITGGPGGDTTVTAGTCGSIAAKLPVEASTPAGRTTLTATSTITNRSATATLNVTRPGDAEKDPPATGGGEGSTDGGARDEEPTSPGDRAPAESERSLPSTGGPAGWLLGLATVLLLAGGLAARAGRRSLEDAD